MTEYVKGIVQDNQRLGVFPLFLAFSLKQVAELAYQVSMYKAMMVFIASLLVEDLHSAIQRSMSSTSSFRILTWACVVAMMGTRSSTSG